MDGREALREFLTPMKILGTTLLFILLFERLGYLLATPLFLLTLFLWVCRYRLRTAVALALGIGIGSWFFFHDLLEVNLPLGVLRFL